MDKAKFIKGKNILIVGGTGTVGTGLVDELLRLEPRTIRVLSNDENGLFHMRETHKGQSELRYLVGDIRDRSRLEKSMIDIDIVFHAAALKHVWLCEYNPRDAIQTNIDGILNLIDAAIEQNVKDVIFTSSDKAVNPSSVMGTTKLLGEKLITSANFSKGRSETKFSSVRFGNILGSRGSIIPIMKKQILAGQPVTITDGRMTRFFLTLQNAVDLILDATTMAEGGEVFILKMEVMKILDLYKAMVELLVPKGTKAPGTKLIGRQAGEKLHEELITFEEIPRTFVMPSMLVVIPELYKDYKSQDMYSKYFEYSKTKKVYSSGSAKPMSVKRLKELIVKENLLQD